MEEHDYPYIKESIEDLELKSWKRKLVWALVFTIPVAIAGLLHPIIAEIAMAVSSITVVTNANLLRRIKI